MKSPAFVLILLVSLFTGGALPITAQTLTPASGGGAISADNTGGAFTTLTGPTYEEAASGNVGVGTIILNAPSGFVFDVGGTAPTVLMERISGGGNSSRNINGLNSGSTIAVTRTSTTLSITITGASNSGVICSLTWQDVRVRPSAGSPLASGNITKSGTSAMTGVTNGTTNFGTLTEVPGTLNKLVVTLPGQTFTSGSGNSGTPTAQTAGTSFNISKLSATDQFFNLVTSYSGSKTISYSGPGGNPSYTTSVSFTGGQSTTTLATTLRKAETTTITAGDGTVSGPASSSLTVNAGTFTKLQLLVPGETAAPGTTTGKTGTPTAQSAGSAFNVTVNAVDANWNLVSSVTHTVGITSSDPNAVLPSNAALVAGTKQFSVTMKTAGARTVTATDITDGGKSPDTSPSITVNAGTFVKLQLLVPGESAAPGTATGKTGTPSSQTAGSAFSVTVNAVDANWNLVNTVTHTVGITSSDVNATLPANAALVAGTRSFSVTLKTAGSRTVTASDITDPLKTADTSPGITVGPAAASKLSIQSQPSASATAGVAFSQQPVVRIEDQFGNLRTGDNSTSVTASRSAGSGTLQGTTVKSALGGVVTFDDLFHTTATKITLSFTSGGLTGTTSDTVNVGPATATRMAFTAQPGSATAGTSFGTQPVVRTQDQFGNNSSVGLPASLTLTVSLVAGSGPLQGTNAMNIGTSGTNGVATFTDLRIDSAGSGKRLGASATGFPDTTSALFTVSPASAFRLTIQTYPSDTATAGTPFAIQPVVRIEDQFGNLRTSDNSTQVTATRGFGFGSLQGSTAVMSSGGVATFTNLFHTAANGITVDFTSSGLLAAASDTVHVLPAPFAKLQVILPGETAAPGTVSGKTGSPNPQTIGVPFSFTVNAVDPYWNFIDSVGDSVGITSSDPYAVLPPAALLAGGTGSFNLTFITTGNRTVTATDLSDPGKSPDTSTSLAVAAGSFVKLQLLVPGETAAPGTPSGKTGAPTPQTAGTLFPVTVNAVDSVWNVVNSVTHTVRITSTDTNATLPGDTPLVAGTKTLNVTLKSAGTQTLTSNDLSDSTKQADTSPSITVSPGAAARLAIQTQPSPTSVAGVTFAQQPVVRVEDAFGNLRSTDNTTQVLAKVGMGTGPLQGTTTATASSGIAPFTNLANNVANITRLRFTSAGLDSATSDTVVITPATADRLVFTTQPGNAVVYSPFGTQPVVETRDQFGNSSVTDLPEVLAVDVDLSAGNGILLGTTSLGIGTTEGNGVVSFTDLQIDSAGTGKQLTATASGMVAAVSSLFAVNTPVPTTTSISPTSKVVGDATFDMTVNGTNFVPSSIVRLNGSNRTTTFVSALQLTVQIPASDVDTAGMFTITVFNPAPGGGTSNGQTFTVNNPVPTLASVNPASGDRLQTLNVGFKGSGFVPGFTTLNVGSGIAINNVTVHGTDSLTANLTIRDSAATGPRNFSVTVPAPGGGTSGTQSFTINNPAPTLTSVNPATGNRLQTLNVVLRGSKFVTNVTQVDFGANITVNTVTVNADTQLTANISIQVAAATGSRDVSVTNPAPGGGSATLVSAFAVQNPAPTIASATPATGARFQTLDVVLKGTNFISGVTSASFGSNITINTTTVNSDTQLTVNISIASIAATGARNIVVTNAAPGGGAATLTNGFTVNNPAPTLASATPNIGDRLQTLDVVLKGTKYISGVSSVSFGTNITVNTTTVNSDTQITANITIGATASSGTRNISVTNTTPGGGTATLTNGFTVNNPSPAIVSVSPASGNRLQTLNVVVKGSKFIQGTTSISFGSNITINTTTVNADTQLTANITITTAASGVRDVVVTNAMPLGGADTLKNAFSVLNPLPSTTRLAPSAVRINQTGTIVITGSNYINGVTSIDFGPDISVNTFNVTSGTQLSANITVGALAETGQRDVIITNASPGGGVDTLRKGLAVFLETETIVLSPSGQGGFDSLGTNNGWTLINGSETNKWAIGTAAKNGGLNGAYISNDGGVTNAYTVTDTFAVPNGSIVHMYRNITFPSGQGAIKLTFDWRGQAEFADYLQVFLVPTTTTVAAGTALASGQIGQGTYNQQGSFVQALIPIDPSFAGTTQRLVFSWTNDASGGDQPPIAIDNVSISTAVPVPLTGSRLVSAFGGTYGTLSEAINDLSLNGVGTGGVTFNVQAGEVFRENPPPIITGGTASNPIRFLRTGGGANPELRPSGFPGSSDFGLCLSGADFVTIDGIDIVVDSGKALEYGYVVRNASSTNGAQNNTIKNTRIVLNRENVTTRGIIQTTNFLGGGVTPTSAAGANSNNKYYNAVIENVFAGIQLIGHSAFPDTSCQIGVTLGGATVIGGAVANDIGLGVQQTYGVRAADQKNIKIFNCEVRNVRGTGTQFVDGILVENGSGLCEVYNNKVHEMNNAASNAGRMCGIRVELTGASSSISKVYNNMVVGLTLSASTVTAPRRLVGIMVQSTGGGSGATHNVLYNTVRMEPAFTPQCSNTCFEIGTTSGPVMNIRNNIFVNATSAQTGGAKHYTMATPSVSSIGPAGSLSHRNLLFVQDTTNGYVGLTNTTDRRTLTNWRTAFTPNQDTTSLSKAVTFVSATDLHLSGPSIGDTSLIGVPLAGYTFDFDSDPRNPVYPYLGADENTDVPLPITLSSFTAQMHQSGRGVELLWTTLSEINNYGFIVQRHSDTNTEFADVPNSFVPGQGTTIVPHDYSFVDSTLTTTGRFHYRLKQIDLDGTTHFTYSISIDVITLSVGETVPHVFKVFQNYPNPFNPRTIIQFSVAQQERATVIMYNILGQEVRRLFDGEALPGQYYKIELDATNLASGAYFYRVATPSRSDVKKMLLLK